MEEELSIQVKPPLNIPTENIYKIHILNETGVIDHVYIFCGGLMTIENKESIFSAIELAYYEQNDVQLIFSEQIINVDDTIRDIKHKIVNEIVNYNKSKQKELFLSLDELYLFALNEKHLDMVQLYKDITENDTLPLTKERFFQYATNISADPYVLDNGDSEKGGLYNDVFTYEQWTALLTTEKQEMFVPIGMEFQDYYDIKFPTNPFKNQLWSEPVRYRYKQKNPLLTMDKSVLLHYTNNRDIMVCLAKPTLDYAEKTNINTTYFCELYFPFLYKRGITSTSALIDNEAALVEETQKRNHAKTQRKYEITQLYREIYWGRKEDLPYIEKGITEFSFVLQSKDIIPNFPLDLLFRNIHTSEELPFVKYNPGNRRENMYRLYTSGISSDGKKIPVLDESQVMRLSRELGRPKQIALYIKDVLPLYVNINTNSEIEINGRLEKPMAINDLDETLSIILNPVIDKLNAILQTSGYELRKFSNINDDNVIHTKLTYKALLAIENKINLQKQIDYISPVFDVLNTDISKGGKMRFKRIRNYKEMDAKSAYIREIYDRTGDSDNVIQGLMDNFDMSEESAIVTFAEFRSQFQLLKQKVVENPGFLTKFEMLPMKNQLVVQIKDIDSSLYIDVLNVYIDVILRMSQKPKTITLGKTKLKSFKTKAKVAKVDEDDDVDTIVVAQDEQKELYKPLQFSPQDDSQIEEDDAAGIEFDDADYYQDIEEESENDDSDDETSSSEFEGGANTPEQDEEKIKANIDNMPIKNPSPFFKRMIELDPTLFVTEESSKFPLYSKACPSGDKRQPIILTDEEKRRIDKTNPGTYGHALHYGSSEDKKHWYVCPRYWCLKTNSSISEEDVKAGKCGTIIPRGADRVPPGAYVYEFNNPKNHMKDGKYRQHVPGFLKKEKHPDNLCIPCCFGKQWNSKDQVSRRQECGFDEEIEIKIKKRQRKTDVDIQPKKQSYIIGSVSYPLPQDRWGFMPLGLQLFFKSDASVLVDPKNSALLKPGEKCLLRYGVEKSEKQSFFSCFAYFYAWKQKLTSVPSIDEMRSKFIDAIDLDMFVEYNNGNLVSTFASKKINMTVDYSPYQETMFYKTLDISNSSQSDYLKKTVQSFENFKKFIEDEESTIDHTYLWDFFCNRNSKLMKDGMNLIILQMANNDITEKVQLMCPSNAYSKVEYDARKETAIIVKQDNFYEPIHLYEQHESIVVAKTDEKVYDFKKGDLYQNGKVINNSSLVYKIKTGETKKMETIYKVTFIQHSALDEIKEILKLIKETSKNYCKPLPSLPKKYDFKHNINIVELIRTLKLYHYQVKGQVLNYRNKAIGLRVNKEDSQSLLFVPCFPSSIVNNIPTIYMDEPELWLDYRQTRDRLNGISKNTEGKVMSKPKIKIIEDGLVIGFLTETNQFVQINPPTQPIDQDGIEQIKHYSYGFTDGEKYKSADKILTTVNEDSSERKTVIQSVDLETQFYNIFRSMVRLYLNQFEYRAIRKEVIDTIEDPYFSYRSKLERIEKEIRKLLDKKVEFRSMDKKDLELIDSVILCKDNCDDDDSPSYCLMNDDGNCVSLFPKEHLLSNKDNEKIYYARIADEFVRYNRTRLFMLFPKTYMNIVNTNFNINNDELFLLESKLTREYFRNLIPYSSSNIRNIGYDDAQPDSEFSGNLQNYSTKISLDDQEKMHEKDSNKKDSSLSNFIVDCIEFTKPNVIGNMKPGSWRKIFPNTAKELFFQKSINCTFIPIIYVFQEVFSSVISIQNIKTALSKGYSDLFKNTSIREKVMIILKKQGKQTLFNSVESGKMDFETALFSDDYYITDLDIWIISTQAKLPIILFTATSLKSLSLPIQWLKLGGRNTSNEKYYFIRSPAEMKKDIPSSYHIIQSGYPLNQLNDEMFMKSEIGDQEYKKNRQSLSDFLTTTTFINKKKN